MMGRLEQDQGQLFYSFCVEEVVPDDHQVRAIASVLDLSWVYGELSPHYPALGRPSIDPVLMIRMLILGYAFGLRSERLLCREVRVNLAYRWFCGLSIEDKIPDHSVFSRARNERFRDNDIFRRVFERVVEACISAGLVGGKEFAVDASLIAADANKQRSIPGSEWIKERDPETASRAVKEYMATLDDAAFGAATKVTPKFVSPSDPAAQWTGAMRAEAIESKLTAMGKDERALSVSGYIYRGNVKYAEYAFNKTTIYKRKSRNHLSDQIESFRIGDKDNKREDDLLDTFCYGIALALGDGGGF
jgi:transposase